MEHSIEGSMENSIDQTFHRTLSKREEDGWTAGWGEGYGAEDHHDEVVQQLGVGVGPDILTEDNQQAAGTHPMQTPVGHVPRTIKALVEAVEQVTDTSIQICQSMMCQSTMWRWPMWRHGCAAMADGPSPFRGSAAKAIGGLGLVYSEASWVSSDIATCLAYLYKGIADGIPSTHAKRRWWW